MVNPYIMGTNLLAARRRRKTTLIQVNLKSVIFMKRWLRKEVKKLPMSLGEALDHLANNDVVQRGMPGEMYRLYDGTSVMNALCLLRMGQRDIYGCLP